MPSFRCLCCYVSETTSNGWVSYELLSSIALTCLIDPRAVRLSFIDGVQFFLLPLVLGKSLFAMIVSNTLYAAALAWYWYITHLGYRTLPFLSQTEVFLFPVAAIGLVYVLNLIGHPFGLGWNASRIMAHIYFD